MDQSQLGWHYQCLGEHDSAYFLAEIILLSPVIIENIFGSRASRLTVILLSP